MTPRIPTADEQADFSVWRTLALARMPYMASLLFSVRLVTAPGLGTFAVDAGHRLYIDFDQVRDWGPVACGEVLLHEVGHLFADHAGQAEEFGIDPTQQRAWNAAADMSLNDDLVQAGCEHIAATGLLPSAVGADDFQTAKHYFDVIQDLQDQQQQSGDGDSGDQGEDTGSDPSDGQPDHDGGSPGNDESDDDNDPGQDQRHQPVGGNEPFSGCGSASGGQQAPCELDEDEDLDGQAPPASTSEHNRVLVSTAAQITEHSSMGRSSVPAGLVEQAELLLAPSVTPWQRVLGSMVRRSVRFRSGALLANHTTRDRRRHDVMLSPGGSKVIYPGRKSPKIRVAVVRDTSGSMSNHDLSTATSEVVAISRRLRIRGKDLTVLDTDAATHSRRGFTRAQDLAQVHGRGGTDMRVGIEAALRTPGGADVIVVLTDGMTPWPHERPRVPVVACLIGDGAEQAAGLMPDWLPHVVADISK